MADQLKVDEMVPVSIVLAFLLRTFLARRGGPRPEGSVWSPHI